MKKKIKKNRLKIFIALSLMFTLITTIFIGTKTFAYTYDEETNYVISDNIWDEQCKNGTSIDTDTGLEVTSAGTTGYSISKNPISILPNTEYYATSLNNKQVVFYYYDVNNNYLGFVVATNSSKTTPNNANWLKIRISENPYENDICINISNPRINGTYEPYGTFINETLYNELEDENEQLQDDYYQLNNDYTQLETDYNTLEDDYNNLELNYNDLNEVYTLGAYAFMKEIDLYFNYSETEDVILNSQQSKALLTNSTLNIYNNIYQQYNEAIEMYIYFNNLNIQYIDFSFVSPTTSELIELYLTNGTNTVVITKTQQDMHINYDWLLEQNEILNDNYILQSIRLKDIYTGDVYNYQYLKSNSPYQIAYSNGLNTGYNNGFNNAKNQYQRQIEELQNANSEILEEVISRDQVIAVLRNQLEASASDYNLNNLMWTIGATPFESFKQIWDVKFFGVNVSELVLGLITTFIALNIAKRFFF